MTMVLWQNFTDSTDGQRGVLMEYPPPPEVENLAKYPLSFARRSSPRFANPKSIKIMQNSKKTDTNR